MERKAVNCQTLFKGLQWFNDNCQVDRITESKRDPQEKKKEKLTSPRRRTHQNTKGSISTSAWSTEIMTPLQSFCPLRQNRSSDNSTMGILRTSYHWFESDKALDPLQVYLWFYCARGKKKLLFKGLKKTLNVTVNLRRDIESWQTTWGVYKSMSCEKSNKK